jgi:hypothetical protein
VRDLAQQIAAAAQEPEIAFDQLHRWLKPGAVVWLTDAQGREIEGKVRDIQPSSLVIEADGTKTFQASDVRQLAERGKRSTKTCLLWGLAGGTGAESSRRSPREDRCRRRGASGAFPRA